MLEKHVFWKKRYSYKREELMKCVSDTVRAYSRYQQSKLTYAEGENVRFLTARGETVLHWMNRKLFNIPKAKAGRGVLQMCTDMMFLNKDLLNFPRTFVFFLQIRSKKAVSSLKISRHVTYLVHIVFFVFRFDHRAWPYQSKHSVERFH